MTMLHRMLVLWYMRDLSQRSGMVHEARMTNGQAEKLGTFASINDYIPIYFPIPCISQTTLPAALDTSIL